MKITGIIFLLSTCLMVGSVSAQSNAWTGNFQAGAGYWVGDATYSIGGNAWTPEEGSVGLPDKISELSFPLDVAYGSIGGSLCWQNRYEIFGNITGNLTDPSSKMEDSDWGVFSDAQTLDIYSESDAKLTAIAADVGARYWFYPTGPANRLTLLLGGGPSLLYQHLDWTISNVDQWYPSQPQLGHDPQEGVAATYNSDIVMPYLNACAVVYFHHLSGRMEIGLGPALVRDEDDHRLRQKRSTAVMAGAGVKGAAELRYDLTKRLFALARMEALSIQATGTSTEKGYGGELTGFYAEIDEEFILTSLQGGFSVGYNF